MRAEGVEKNIRSTATKQCKQLLEIYSVPHNRNML
nr:MAG TPA: hypothetical protein [Caudoviricetes sp.]